MATKTHQVLTKHLQSLNTIDPREYQQSISKIASNNNTLIILPTALGKTIIAITIAIDRLQKYPWGKIVVVAPTKPLVHQHKETFEQFLGVDTVDGDVLHACELNGRIQRKQRKDLYENSNLIFSTPQTIRNDIASDLYNFSECTLLVIDECHRTGKNYAYNHLAYLYMMQNPDPIILGLTASPGRSDEKIDELCNRLFIERVTIRTQDDPDVKPYIHPINIETRRCDLPLAFHELIFGIGSMIIDRVEHLQENGFLAEKDATRVNKMDMLKTGHQLWGTLDANVEYDDVPENFSKPHFFSLVNLQAQCIKLMHLKDLISTQTLFAADCFIKRMKEKVKSTNSHNTSDWKLLNDPEFQNIISFMEQSLAATVQHPKLEILLELLELSILGEDGKVIVFTQYRDTVTWLLEKIQGLNKKLHGNNEIGKNKIAIFRPVRFVGQSSRFLDPGMNQNEQREILNEFSKGTYNILVATRIAEEGLDIPSVNTIIFYEPVPSEIRYIQRKGRTGRHEMGNVSILIANDTIDEIFSYLAFNRAEKMETLVRNLDGYRLQSIPRLPMQKGDIKKNKSCLPEEICKSRENVLASHHLNNSMGEFIVHSNDTDQKEYEERESSENVYSVNHFINIIDERERNFCEKIKSKAIVQRNIVNWHELLKKMTGKKTYKLKRTKFSKPKTEGGITLYNKALAWIYEQIHSFGIVGEEGCGGSPSGKTLEMSLGELKQMAEFEELDMEDFDYNLKSGVKKEYWSLKADGDGGKTIVMDAEL